MNGDRRVPASRPGNAERPTPALNEAQPNETTAVELHVPDRGLGGRPMGNIAEFSTLAGGGAGAVEKC
jgi:hypothetical protein